MLRALRVCFPLIDSRGMADKDGRLIWSALQRAAWTSHLHLDGLATDEEMAACGFMRPDKTETGISRVLRSMRQQKLDEILSHNPK